MIWPLLYTSLLTQSCDRWTTIERGLTATWDDVPPPHGTHLIYELQARSDQASTPSNLLMFVNGDVTSANYHFQRYLSQDAVASATEGTTANGAQAAGDTSVAAYYSSVFILVPWFRSARQKVFLGFGSTELTTNSQQLLVHVQKRQGAGITGALVDPITAVQFRHPVFNFQGTMRRTVV